MRWLGVMVATALSSGGALLLDCTTSPSCVTSDGSAGDCDGGDATLDAIESDANEAGGCACPKPDAALFNPNGTSCCAGSSCVAGHSDGLGQGFYDCYGVGAWATQLAMDACHAYFDASVTCTSTTCGPSQVIEGTTTKCVTWAYQGTDTSAIGRVHVATGATCVCPDAGDPSWY